jgi:hypothetical protein
MTIKNFNYELWQKELSIFLKNGIKCENIEYYCYPSRYFEILHAFDAPLNLRGENIIKLMGVSIVISSIQKGFYLRS